MVEVYLLNLYPGTITVTVTDNTNGNSQTYTLAQYQYVDISSMISSPCDDISVHVPGVVSGNIELFPSANAQTISITGGEHRICIDPFPVDVILKETLYNNILRNMNTDLANVYEALLSLISDYASGKSLSQSALSNVSSTLQQIKNMLQNAIQFENETSTSFEGVSAYQQAYNNLNQIYESLTNHTLTVEELQNLQLPSYSTPEASSIASTYTQFLNKAINTMESASSQNNSSTPSSSSTPTSTSSPTTHTTSTTSPTTSPVPTTSSPTSAPTSSQNNSSTPSSSSTPTSTSSPTTPNTMESASSQNSSTTSPTTSTSPTTISQGQVLAQIQAGDLSSLQSEISEIPPNMIPVVSAVTQLYQLYDIPEGTPLSTVVERLLSDIRDAYYNISNHKQEQVNTQQLSTLLKIYNTLASSGLAPQSQSASKLSNLVQTSGIMPAIPSVLGQPYPGNVYSNSNLV